MVYKRIKREKKGLETGKYKGFNKKKGKRERGGGWVISFCRKKGEKHVKLRNAVV